MTRKTIAIILALCLTIFAAATDKKKKCGKEDSLPLPDLAVKSLTPEQIVTPSEEPMTVTLIRKEATKGIDVSHYQGNINWAQVAEDSQVGYCYIKATESSTYIDDRYAANIKQARKAGIKAGAYHFFSPTTSPTEQLRNFTNVVKKKEQDLIPLIDVEKMTKRGNPKAFRQRLKIFLDGVERHYGVRPLIYTGENFFNKYLTGHFQGYSFMIAKYREEPPVIFDNTVKIIMWQYTSEGRINGIRGNCDQSIFINNFDIKDILLK